MRALLDGAGVSDAGNVTVVLGNEPNICVEWECWERGRHINISTMAAEWGAYTEDLFTALSPLGVQLAAGPFLFVVLPFLKCRSKRHGDRGALPPPPPPPPPPLAN
eukprot:COSAG01_NODE_242_length_20582_cov_314.397256_4_plen_106_part_00